MSRSLCHTLVRSLLLGGALAGCAHGTTPASLEEMRLKLTDAQRKEAEERRRIEDLENRVFLLSDQLETQKLAAANVRPPRLPVVTLRPTREAEEAIEPRRDEPRADARRDAELDELRADEGPERTRVSRTGDPPRRVLRGEGPAPVEAPVTIEEPRESQHESREAPAPRKHARPSQPEEVRLVSQQSGDSLGVAPVPPIPKAPPFNASPITLEHPALPQTDREPLTQYRTAYADVTAGHYEDAEKKLRAFVHRFPHHDYADNAQYWIGECFYARNQYREAAVEFRTTVDKYPTGNKAPDALLKLAYSLLALGDAGEARRLLEALPTTYPRSEASRLAAQKLAELAPSTRPVIVEDPR